MLKNQENLFFIIGLGRSGTSLLQELMNTFDDFCNIGESRIYGDKITSLWTPVRRNEDFKPLENFIKEHWTKKNFVEKTPDSILCLKQLKKHFPNSNYLFLERNPRDVLLSSLNMHVGSLDTFERYYHIDNLMMDENDLLLPREQYWAKLILVEIYHQLIHKNEFQSKIIIKYEDIINSPEKQLKKIEKHFGITVNFDQAKVILGKPSYSTKETTKIIKSIDDKIAIDMISTACRLWGYNF